MKIHFVHLQRGPWERECLAVLLAAGLHPQHEVIVHTNYDMFEDAVNSAAFNMMLMTGKQMEFKNISYARIEAPWYWRGVYLGHNAQYMSDVLRLEILQKEGGLYVDTDYYFIRPLDTLGIEGFEGAFPVDTHDPENEPAWTYKGKANTCFLYAQKQGRFIERLIYRTAADLHKRVWGYHTGHSPVEVLMWNPDLLGRVKRFKAEQVLGASGNSEALFTDLRQIPLSCGIHAYATFNKEKTWISLKQACSKELAQNTFQLAIQSAVSSLPDK